MQIFLHIPKTAGTTLNHVLRNQYRGAGLVHHSEQANPREAARDFLDLYGAQRQTTQLFKGHVHFGVHQYLPSPSSYFTVLRDPIERVISHYYYVLAMPSNVRHASVVSQKMTLKDYVASGLYTELDNGQTRMLAGCRGLPNQTEFGCCGEELLALAEANLRQHFSVVGVQEEFDSTLLLLQRAFRWQTPFYVNLNVTPKKPRREEIPTDTLDVIREYTQIDACLYSHVTERFHHEIVNGGPTLTTDLERFRSLNRSYGRVYRWIDRAGSRAGRLLEILFRSCRA